MGKRSEKTKKPNLQPQDQELSDFLIAPHCSFFISLIHFPLFTVHYSIAHSSFPIVHYSLFIVHYSFPTVHYSLFK